jgi:hypothetical protein
MRTEVSDRDLEQAGFFLSVQFIEIIIRMYIKSQDGMPSHILCRSGQQQVMRKNASFHVLDAMSSISIGTLVMIPIASDVKGKRNLRHVYKIR